LAFMGVASMVSDSVADGGRWQRRLRNFCHDVRDLASVWCLAVDDVVAPAACERRWTASWLPP
ncbi:hypothetical protein U1Q18_025393, partial [Sarracenia purpurea var. burkii]